ncbi:MAG: hypothetical protein U1E76_17950 [Planctomycetota bacterium]
MAHAAAPTTDWVELRREVHEARDGLARLRWWHLANAILTLVPALLLGIVVWQEAARHELSAVLVVLAAVVTVQLGAMVLGLLRVAVNPLAWTVVIAVSWTLNLGACLLGDLAWLRLGLTVFCTLCAWLFVPSAARLRAQLAAHPGLHEPHPLERATGPGTEELHRRRERQAAERRRVLTRDLLIGAAVVLAFGASMAGLWRSRRPPPFTLQGEFVKAWNEASIDAVAALADEDYRDRLASFLRRSVARRGWDRRWPVIASPTITRGENVVKAHYALDHGSLEVWWELKRRAWVLKAVSLPGRD